MVLRRNSFIIVSLVLLALLVAGCGGKNETTGQKQAVLTEPITVKVVHIAPGEQYYETSGSVKARIVSQVAAKTLGQVTALYVQSGQAVAAGQVLADVMDRDISQRILAAKAGVREAEKGMQVAERNRSLQASTYNRYAKLYDQAAISRQQVDEFRSAYEVAELSYEQAEAALEKANAALAEASVYGQIVAPISGVVTEKNLEVGSMVQPGVAAITVEDRSSYLVECYVEAALHEQVVQGMTVPVVISSLKEPIMGRVTEVVPAVDKASRSFLVKVSLNDSRLQTGLYGTVQFPVGQTTRLVVPKTAIVEKGQLTGVYVLAENKILAYRLVRTGRTIGNGVEIISGLQDGDYIVTKGVETAIDGALAKEVEGL